MKAPKMRSPYEARDIDHVCELRTDHHDTAEFWIMTDGYEVTLHQQMNGSPSRQSITIPRADFNRLIRWYMKPQRVNKNWRKD